MSNPSSRTIPSAPPEPERFKPRAKRLSDARLKTLKPKAKPFDTWDSGVRGLLLHVGKNRMTWMIACRMPTAAGGNARAYKRMTLDRQYPATGLKEARELAEVALKQAKEQRETPRQAQEKAQAAKDEAEKAEAARAALKCSLGDLCDEYVAHLHRRGKVESANHAKSMFHVHVKSQAAIATRPACEVGPEEIADLLRPAYSDEKKRAAGITRSYLSAAFRCAARARVSIAVPVEFKRFSVIGNPVAAIESIPVAIVRRKLSPVELRDYLSRLEDNRLSDRALRLCLYMGGQRLIQTLRVKLSAYDATAKTLQLIDPKGRRSEPREHLVPLGPKAAALVDNLAARAKSLGSQHLFASGRAHATRKSLTGRMATIRKAMGCEHFDLKDIRRTCETMLAGLGVSKDIRAQLLSHGLAGVQGRYDMHAYLTEKRDALVRWEAHLDALGVCVSVAAR